ncbi:MAG TPA: Crp/Fnr family transcriptional regulator [Chitinophagaceae bacterium]|nr:Crp/Fnr family transcriptional regulator [Chitinophagaceae bacterium]
MTQSLDTVFPSFEKELLEEIANKGELKTFKEDETLVKTGQYFRSILLIVDGLIKVYREDQEGNEFFIYYLQPGQACALSMKCQVRNETSQVMVRAVTETSVITVPIGCMDDWMQKYKSWYHFVLDTYRNRIEELLQTIDDIAFRNMDERLLSYIKREKQVHNSPILTINHTEVAEELNSSREVVSRLMKKVSEKGLIRLLKNQQVEILDDNLLETQLAS